MQRHELDGMSLGSGLVLAVIGVAFLTGRVDLARLDVAWVAPVAAIVVGLVLLVRLLRRAGRQGLE